MLKSVLLGYILCIIGHTVAEEYAFNGLDTIIAACKTSHKNDTLISEADEEFKSCSRDYTNLVFSTSTSVTPKCATFEHYNKTVSSLIDKASTCYDDKEKKENFEIGKVLVLEMMDLIYNKNVTKFKAAVSYLKNNQTRIDTLAKAREYCFETQMENGTSTNITERFKETSLPLSMSLFFNMEPRTCIKAKSYAECIKNSILDETLENAFIDLFNFVWKDCPSNGFSLKSGLGFLLGFFIITLTY